MEALADEVHMAVENFITQNSKNGEENDYPVAEKSMIQFLEKMRMLNTNHLQKSVIIFSRLGGYEEKITKCMNRISSHEISDNLENGAHLDCLAAFKDEMTKLILSLYLIQL